MFCFSFFSKTKFYLNSIQLQVALSKTRNPCQTMGPLYVDSNIEEMQVAYISYLTIHVIHWNIKIAHGLPWMKITSKNTICTCFCNQICYKFGCNWFTPLSLKDQYFEIMSKTNLNSAKTYLEYQCWLQPPALEEFLKNAHAEASNYLRL